MKARDVLVIAALVFSSTLTRALVFAPMALAAAPSSGTALASLASSGQDQLVRYDLVTQQQCVHDGRFWRCSSPGFLIPVASTQSGALGSTASAGSSVAAGAAAGVSSAAASGPVSLSPASWDTFWPTSSPRTVHILLKDFVGEESHCSGILIDPRHVLTAAHCIHLGGQSDAWKGQVEVIPAHQGTDADGLRPLGSAFARRLYAWTSWTERGIGWGYADLGVIALDRPFLGRILRADTPIPQRQPISFPRLFGAGPCSPQAAPPFLTRQLHLILGYPGTSPFDGTQMYGRSAFVAGCGYGTAIGLGRGFKGQSGSGVVASGDLLWGVYSGQQTFGNLWYASVLEGWMVDQIRSVIIPENSPDVVPDLVPMPVIAQPRVRDSMWARIPIHNASHQAFSGTLGISIFASPRQDLGSVPCTRGGSVLPLDQCFTRVHQATTQLQIPPFGERLTFLSFDLGKHEEIGAGVTHFLFSRIEKADADVLNNTSTVGASSFVREAAADLVVSRIEAPSSVEEDNVVLVRTTVRNQGARATSDGGVRGDFTVRIGIAGTPDCKQFFPGSVADLQFPELIPGAQSSLSTSVTIPADPTQPLQPLLQPVPMAPQPGKFRILPIGSGRPLVQYFWCAVANAGAAQVREIVRSNNKARTPVHWVDPAPDGEHDEDEPGDASDDTADEEDDEEDADADDDSDDLAEDEEED